MWKKYIKGKQWHKDFTQEQLTAMSGVGFRFIREQEADKSSFREEKVNAVYDKFGYEMDVGTKDKEMNNERSEGILPIFPR